MLSGEQVNSKVERILARLAHRVWTDRMLAEGWQYGAVYSPEAHTHDGLIAFSKLDATDQATALNAVKSSGIVELLQEIVDYPRADRRQFRPEDLFHGRRVTSDGSRTSKSSDTGSVVDWRVEAGVVEEIRVRWDDGVETVHAAGEGDLRPAQ